MNFIVLALAFIGAASAGFIAPLNTYSSVWNHDLGLGYGAGYYGLGATAYAAPALHTYAAPALSTYAAPAFSAYAAPAFSAYAAPAISTYGAYSPLNSVYAANTLGLTGYVAPTYGFDLLKKKKA